LGQAQAQRALAQINVNRDTPLAEAHAIARSQFDNEIQQKAQAEASVRTAEAAVSTANLRPQPRLATLSAFQFVLTSVSQLDSIKVYFSIGDSEYLARS
jgi:membrane fusion protein (multidrug efflux system)